MKSYSYCLYPGALDRGSGIATREIIIYCNARLKITNAKCSQTEREIGRKLSCHPLVCFFGMIQGLKIWFLLLHCNGFLLLHLKIGMIAPLSNCSIFLFLDAADNQRGKQGNRTEQSRHARTYAHIHTRGRLAHNSYLVLQTISESHTYTIKLFYTYC